MSTLTLTDALDQDFAELLQQQAAELTRAFINFCSVACFAKRASDRGEWKSTKDSLGWGTSTPNPYAKIGEWLADINAENLELLDINTIKSLCCEKYRSILEQLKGDRLTIAEVREQMRQINQATKRPKQPAPALEWKKSKSGDRSLVIRLQDAEAGDEFEAKYKASGQPLPLFLRSLLRGQADTWQQANDELTQYIDNQVTKTDEIAQIEKQIAGCDRLIAQYADSTNASEIMVRRIAIEDKLRLEKQLQQLLVIAA